MEKVKLVVSLVILLIALYFALYSYMGLAAIALIPLILNVKNKDNTNIKVLIIVLSSILLLVGLFGIFISY